MEDPRLPSLQILLSPRSIHTRLELSIQHSSFCDLTIRSKYEPYQIPRSVELLVSTLVREHEGSNEVSVLQKTLVTHQSLVVRLDQLCLMSQLLPAKKFGTKTPVSDSKNSE